MKSLISNSLEMLLRALELNLQSGSLKPWVVFPHASLKNYFYYTCAKNKSPYAIEPFYLDELIGFLTKEKKRLSAEEKQWLIEDVLEKSSRFSSFSKQMQNNLIQKEGRTQAKLFSDCEQYTLEALHDKLWQALFARDGAPLSELDIEIPEGVAIHVFGFSSLGTSWIRLLEKLGSTLYLTMPSLHHLEGAETNPLLGKWTALKRHTLGVIRETTPLMLIPKSVATNEHYKPYLLGEMGVIEDKPSRLSFLKGDLVTGRLSEPIDAPLDESVQVVRGDERYIALEIKKALTAGKQARDLLLYCSNLHEKAPRIAAALRREKIPFSICGLSSLRDNPLARGWLTALKTAAGMCRREELQMIFPEDKELRAWLSQVDRGYDTASLNASFSNLGYDKPLETQPFSFRAQLTKWLEKTLSEGEFFAQSALGEKLALLDHMLVRAKEIFALPPRKPSEWAELFEAFFKTYFDGDSDQKKGALAMSHKLYCSVDVQVSSARALIHFEELLHGGGASINFTSDVVHVAPLDPRFALPASTVFVMLDESLSEEHKGEVWIPSAKDQSNTALLDLIGFTTESLVLCYSDEMPTLLREFIAYDKTHFTVALEEHIAPIPTEREPKKNNFFTTWEDVPKTLPNVELTLQKMQAVRKALTDPIGWFLEESGGREEKSSLFPSPLERAIAVREKLAGIETKRYPGLFGEGAELLSQHEVAIKQERLGSMRCFDLILTPQVSRMIETDEGMFVPSLWLEGKVTNVSDKGLIVFGRDEKKIRARSWVDLLALALAGLPTKLFMIDLAKEIPFSIENPEEKIEALSRYVKLAKLLPSPLLPEAVEPLLANDAAAFAKALEIEHPEALMELWRPLAETLFEVNHAAV